MTQLLMRRENLIDLPPLPQLPEGYIMRDYRSEDLSSLTALLQQAFPEENWTPESVLSRLIHAEDVTGTLLIVYDNSVAATASCRYMPEKFPEAGYVHYVAAAEEHQGNRLGYAITLALLYRFVKEGRQHAVLETDDHRLAAIKTYQNLGFKPEHSHDSHPERWAEIAARLLAAANL